MIETFANVWDALEDDPQEASRLTVMLNLMLRTTWIAREHRLPPAEAAAYFRARLERITELLAARIGIFKLGELVGMVAAFGRKVRVSIEAA